MVPSRPSDDDKKGALLVYLVLYFYLQFSVKNSSLLVNKFASAVLLIVLLFQLDDEKPGSRRLPRRKVAS
jgi:hypothetical protein